MSLFHSCKLALGEDKHSDEREWQLRLAKSRKRQRRKKKDDALVASFFSHVEDPVAMCIVELLLDYSMMDCRDGGDDDVSHSTNDCDKVSAVASTKTEHIQDQSCSRHCDGTQNQCMIVEEDADDQVYFFDAMDYDSEAACTIASLHPMIVETDSERTVKTGSVQSHTSIDGKESNKSERKRVNKSVIVDSLTRNVKRIPSAGKENVTNKDDSKIGKRPQQTSLHHLSNIRRSPFHDSSKTIVLASRQKTSLALNSF